MTRGWRVGTVPQIPVAGEHEPGPVERVPPAPLAHELELGGPERGGRLEVVLPHRLVEPRHQVGGSLVVHLPEARQHLPRPGVHEAPHEADQALARHPLAHGAAAAAQHDEVDGQLHVVDVVEPHEALARRAVLVDQ